MTSDWVIVARYSSRTEAELFSAILEREGIPVVTRGSDVGIFGPGFSGATALGVQLLVHSQDVDRAQELLGAEDDAEES